MLNTVQMLQLPRGMEAENLLLANKTLYPYDRG